jgi:hypothetical protein
MLRGSIIPLTAEAEATITAYDLNGHDLIEARVDAIAIWNNACNNTIRSGHAPSLEAQPYRDFLAPPVLSPTQLRKHLSQAQA